MEEKNAEKILCEALGQDKPNRSVLAAARAEMDACARPKKRGFLLSRRILNFAACAAAVIILAIALPLGFHFNWFTGDSPVINGPPINGQCPPINGQYPPTSGVTPPRDIGSAADFAALNGLNLLSFDNEIVSSVLHVNQDGAPVRIEETYKNNAVESLVIIFHSFDENLTEDFTEFENLRSSFSANDVVFLFETIEGDAALVSFEHEGLLYLVRLNISSDMFDGTQTPPSGTAAATTPQNRIRLTMARLFA